MPTMNVPHFKFEKPHLKFKKWHPCLHPTRLQWIWSVNSPDVGQYTTEEYSVGENYTHWLGIDGYNWGSSESRSK